MSNILHHAEYDWSEFRARLAARGETITTWAVRHGLARKSVYNMYVGFWPGNGKRGTQIVEAALADDLIFVKEQVNCVSVYP